MILLVVGLFAAAAWVYTSQSKEENTVQIYFFKGAKLTAVNRPITPNEQPLTKAIKELLSGPTKEEAQQGVVSYLPGGTKVSNVRASGRTAIINFNSKLEDYGGGTARVEGMIAQIVYTTTGISGIDKAWIWMNGEKEIVLGGEGLVLDKPLGRADISY